MLYGVHFYNDKDVNPKHFIFGIRARSLDDAMRKTGLVIGSILKHEKIVDPKLVTEITGDGVFNAADIAAWAGLDSGFVHGKYKDKPFMRVRYTDTVPTIKGGYISVGGDRIPGFLSSLVQFH